MLLSLCGEKLHPALGAFNAQECHKVNLPGVHILFNRLAKGFSVSRYVKQVIDELERRDLKRGLGTMCAAGGMAPAIIIERV